MMNLKLHEIQELESEFGNPLYVFDESSFIHNYNQLVRSMRKHYPKYKISYSYKTNYTPYICSIVKKLGGYAEVVSGMEYGVAKRIGHNSKEIIYNGPNKGIDGIRAVFDGAIVNIDNLEELYSVCTAAERKESCYKIGLRVNLDIGQSFLSRFGMDEKELAKAFEYVSTLPNVKVAGLHCHISRCRGIEAWRKRTNYMLLLADRYFTSKLPEYLDLGSGMFGEMDLELASQFEDVPTYEDYASVTAQCFAEHYSMVSEEEKPFLITEPGTTLINKNVDFFGKVNIIKCVRGKHFAILNCSEQNLGETCTLKKLPIRVIHSGKNQDYYTNIDMVGYTCLEQDVLYKDYTGKIGLGDYVQFGNVGGYSNVYKPPFIWPNCAMLVKKANGSYNLIKKSETYDDLLNTYIFSTEEI